MVNADKVIDGYHIKVGEREDNRNNNRYDSEQHKENQERNLHQYKRRLTGLRNTFGFFKFTHYTNPPIQILYAYVRFLRLYRCCKATTHDGDG